MPLKGNARRWFWKSRELPLSFVKDLACRHFRKSVQKQTGKNGTLLPGFIWAFRISTDRCYLVLSNGTEANKKRIGPGQSSVCVSVCRRRCAVLCWGSVVR